MLLFINDEVISDVNNIKDYISADDNLAAEKIIKEIFDTIENIPSSPESGMNLNNYTKRKNNYRFRIVKPYLIFYKIEKNAVRVYRVLHGSMPYLKLLEIK
jgi:plasmid stabilization system protein ParE